MSGPIFQGSTMESDEPFSPSDFFLMNITYPDMPFDESGRDNKLSQHVTFLPGNKDNLNESGHFITLYNGSSLNWTAKVLPEDARFVYLRYSVIVLYLLTFLFGLLGNSLTILVIIRNNKMKTVASCFILNLAIADDLFIFSLPFFAHNTFAKTWVFGSVACSLMSAFYGINLYASIFTMVLMSIDRYLAIVHPLRSIRYRTIKNAMIVCVCIWCVCIVIMTPHWLYTRTVSMPDGRTRCNTLNWPILSKKLHIQFWDSFELIIGFVLPIVVMVICYMELLRHIVKEDGPLQNQTKMPIKRVTIMVFMVTIVFIVCWTPYHILKYVNSQRKIMYMQSETRVPPPENDRVMFAIYNVIAQALVFISSCSNPFIYGISSKNFRRMYISIVCKCCLPYELKDRRGRRSQNQRASSYYRGRSITERLTEMTVSCTDAPNGSSMAMRRFDFSQKGEDGMETQPARQTYKHKLNPEESLILMEQSLM